MAEDVTLFVGTYTRMGSEGIYTCSMSLETGALELRAVTGEIENPSFLAADPTGDHLYAVCEVGDDGGHGAVTAYTIVSDGSLRALNRQSTGGPGPCHLAVDASDAFVIAANYQGGSLSVLPIQEDGRLREATHVVRHQGSSVNPSRQDAPHPHSVFVDHANRYVFAPDLGLDKIMVYRLDLTAGSLTPNDQPWVPVKAGPGRAISRFIRTKSTHT